MEKDASAAVGKTPCDHCHKVSTGQDAGGGFYCEDHKPKEQANTGSKEASSDDPHVAMKEAGVTLGSR